jgi:hypothetical protein
MSVYARPVWQEPVFRDATGAVIEYGSRWGQDGPPTDTYSVVTHPERFAPLHLVADALIEHLVDTYDVQISHDPAHAHDFVHPMDFLRVTRVTPADPAAAPLTFAFTGFPAVIVHAGLLHDFVYPICGCDACDDTADGQVEMLEQHVLAVAAGNYREAYTPGEELPLTFSLRRVDGAQSGRSLADGYPVEQLTAAGKRLRELPGGWTAWPLS